MKYTFIYAFFILTLFIGLCSCSTKKIVQTEPAQKEDEKFSDSSEIVDDIIINKANFKFHFINSNLLSKVLDISAKENKLVYLDINASWCTPCKLMQRDVYMNDEMATLFNNNFINYMVDVDYSEGPDLKLIYDIHVIPTLLFLDAKGRIVLKKEGAAYPTELKKIAIEALSLHK